MIEWDDTQNLILYRIYMTQTVSRSLNRSRQRPLESVYLLRRSLSREECNERKSPPFSSSCLMGQNSIDKQPGIFCVQRQVLTPKILSLKMFKCHKRRRHLFHSRGILMHSFSSISLNHLLDRTNKERSRVQGWF